MKYFVNFDFEFVKYDLKIRILVDGGVMGGKVVELYVEEGFLKVLGEVSEFEKV